MSLLIHGGAFAMGDSEHGGAEGAGPRRRGFRGRLASITDSAVRRCSRPAPRTPRRRSASCGPTRPEYGIDPDRIGAWGSSAGGWLASMLVPPGRPEDRLRRPCAGQPGRVQCGPGGGGAGSGLPTSRRWTSRPRETTACGGQSAGSRCRRLTGVEVARRSAGRRSRGHGPDRPGLLRGRSPERAGLLLRPRRLGLQRPRWPVAPAGVSSRGRGRHPDRRHRRGCRSCRPADRRGAAVVSIAFLRATLGG